MNDPRDEPIADLRRAWRTEAPLPRALETGALEDCDPATRASVAWLRAAHHARAERETPESVPLPVQLAHARARRRADRRILRRPASVVGGLAAAALLLIFARTLVVVQPPDGSPVHVADVETPTPASVPSRITDVPPERFRSRDDGIELVSGSVRLVLLTPTTLKPDRGEQR